MECLGVDTMLFFVWNGEKMAPAPNWSLSLMERRALAKLLQLQRATLEHVQVFHINTNIWQINKFIIGGLADIAVIDV